MEEKTIVSKTGNIIYTSARADLSEKERRLMDLINGAKPQNEEEEKIAREIKDIEIKSSIVKMPFD